MGVVAVHLYPFNLTQQPAASLPCGFNAAGLPVALQLVGRRFDDATVLRAARAYERTHPFRLPPMPPPGDTRDHRQTYF